MIDHLGVHGLILLVSKSIIDSAAATFEGVAVRLTDKPVEGVAADGLSGETVGDLGDRLPGEVASLLCGE